MDGEEPVQKRRCCVGQRMHHTPSVTGSNATISEDLREKWARLKQIHTNEDGGGDVQLQIDTKLFKTESAWLAAHSKYFGDMFFGDASNSEYTRGQPIILEDIDVTAFEEFYNFMYTYDLRVNDSNVLQLLQLNDKFNLYAEYFKKECIEHVKSRSEAPEPISNALDLLEFACGKKEDSLIPFLHAHISRHLYYYSKEACLEKLPFEYMSSLLKFSKNYILPLRVSEKVILMIIHNWINHNHEERSLYRYTLMEIIDGANVSPSCSELLVDRQDKVETDTESHSLLKALLTGIDVGLPTDAAQLSATISFDVQNVSAIRLGEIMSLSPHTAISNLMWKIGIGRIGNSLSMYLDCGGTDSSSEWSCYASAVFTVTSNKEGAEDFVTGFNFGIFSSNEDDRRPIWFASDVLKWNDLMNPENGYVQDDGSICLNAHVQADVPFRKLM